MTAQIGETVPHHATPYPQKKKLTETFFIATEIKVEDDLIPPGAKPGTVPTDFVQATGLERLELIGKMQGIDIFDMRPLDASRKGMFAVTRGSR
ncbi:Cytochrome c oxidase subunit 4 [Penicillium capsulatum]|uniref:Cytochrome c oxidase subunit 4 n=1 Tax=Penicillium capsulatum TaxID=69766 RepID=A0A9W9LHN5_9EURO|nr:Cytochrome c oxidase subunit 4 [Penicillium capsulatum]